MVERQIRWNRLIDTGEQTRLRYKYVFAIINEPREIEIIERKLLEELAPVDGYNRVCDWVVRRSNGLHCKVISFSSERGVITHPKKVYDSPKFHYDRRLLDLGEVLLSPHLRTILGD